VRVALVAAIVRLVAGEVIVPYDFTLSYDIPSVVLMLVNNIILVNDVVLVSYNVLMPVYLLRPRAVKNFPLNVVLFAVTATA